MILITIDCLRADHLSCYGYERKTTRFLDFLSTRGMRFENAFSSGPFTSASFLSILASAYPLEFKDQLPLPSKALLISEVLQKNGIRTAAVHSNPYLSAFYGYNRGWHCFRDFLPINPNGNPKRGKFRRLIRNGLPRKISELYYLSKVFCGFVESYENAETITKCAISWLNVNKEHPFFCWVHYMDLHEPYLTFNAKLSRKYSRSTSRMFQVKFFRDTKQRNINPKTIRGIVDIYDDKLSYIDENIRKLFNFLNQEGLLESTLLVLTSDHGQEFLDHGSFGHTARFYEEILHIPLILYGEKVNREVNRHLVSHIDIGPTILNFCDITAPEEYRGHNILSLQANRFIISEAAHNEQGVYISGRQIFPSNLRTYAIRTKKWKYIFKEKGHELYNLDNDPKERINIINEEVKVRKELEAIVSEHMLWETKQRKRRMTLSEKERVLGKIKKLETIG